MRQVVGYLLILSFFPLLFFISSQIQNEYDIAKTYEQHLKEDIELPEVKKQLPFTMVDRNGNIFNEEYVEWRNPIEFDQIPEVIKQIFLLSEDQQFYEHIGFDVSAIMRAVVANSSENSIKQGGSTITQQLVRMRYLSTEKTYERKLMEIFYAYQLEKMYNKEEIFEMYLNETYYGNKVYGIGAAATYYFQKPLDKLSISEMAFLAAIPNNPSLYDPIKNFKNTKTRQERLIDMLAQQNVITADEAKDYKKKKIKLNVKEKIQQYPAYSTYVLEELKQLIANNEGFEKQLKKAKTKQEKEKINKKINDKLNKLAETGFIIHTALDPQKQEMDERNINAILSVKDLQASAVVIENSTREIVSIYAGKNYKKYDFHRAYQGTRQPGSSFKPLLVYAPLFENTNYTPRSIVSGGKYCIGNFCPQNFGGAIYGNVSVSTAFRNSLNTSAVRLFEKVGIDKSFEHLNQFQFNSIVKADHNYAAALGGLTYGVTPLEMADAYTSFIDGSYIKAKTIRKITDLEGKVIYSWPSERKTVWSDKTVSYIRQMLHEVVTNGTGKGIYSNSSYIGAKTGTTNDRKDYWLAGLTNEYTTAVWIGYDTPKDMVHIQNSKIHFKIFNAIMN